MSDIYYEEDDSQENEDDISASSPELFSSAVLSSNDWTTETIIAQINKKISFLTLNSNAEMLGIKKEKVNLSSHSFLDYQFHKSFLLNQKIKEVVI